MQKSGTKYFGEKLADAVHTGAEQARDAVASFSEQGRELASAGAEKAAETASSLTQRAKEMASSAAEKVKDTAAGVASAVSSTLSEKADAVSSAVGEGMKSMAGTIRDKTPSEGIIGTATSTVANTLAAGGDYIEHEGFGGMYKDLTAVIRKNPWPALFVGIGIGFLLARASSKR